VRGIRGALLRYRYMAYIVGTGLVILVLVGMPLQYGAHYKGVVEIVGPIHGFLYIVYLAAALDMARRCRFTLLQMLFMIGAGLVPFLAFIIERSVTARVEARFAQEVKAVHPA
jgi:integral membrane protein